MKNMYSLLDIVNIILLSVISVNYAQNFTYGSNVDKIIDKSYFGDWLSQNKLTIIYIEQNHESNHDIISYLDLLSNWGGSKILIKKFSVHNFDDSFVQLSREQVFFWARILTKYPSGYFLIFDESKIVRYSGDLLSPYQLTQILKNYLNNFGIINKHRLSNLYLCSKNLAQGYLSNKLSTHSTDLYLFISTNCENCNIEIINNFLQKASQVSDLNTYIVVPDSSKINYFIDMTNNLYWVKEKKDYDLFLLNDIWVATFEYDKEIKLFFTKYDLYNKLNKFLDARF